MNELIKLSYIKEFKTIFSDEIAEFRIVGGAVRDLLLERELKDVDIATTFSPEELLALAEKRGVKAIPTGIDYGTITLIISGKPIEVTSLRSDVETDGRHAIVSYSKDYKADAARRDFTINAIYIDFSGELYDFYNGKQDLEKKMLRFIGDSELRIKEDYLRILRLFRFYAELDGFVINEEALRAVNKLQDGLMGLSGERIKAELFKLLDGQNYKDSLALMAEHGILNFILPQDQESLDKLEIFAKNNKQSPGHIALSALLMQGKDISMLKKQLKLSNLEERIISFLQAEGGNYSYKKELDIQKSLVTIGRERAYYDYCYSSLCQGVKMKEGILAQINKLDIPKFPVTGDDLIEQGHKPGKTLGEVLCKLKKAWLDSNFTLSKQSLLK